MKPKLTILIAMLLLICQTGYSQVYKYRAKEYAYMAKDRYDRWSDWTDWKKCNILIVIDLDSEKFTIYSAKTQVFDVIKYYEKKFDEDGVETFKMLVVDNNGLRCNIRQRFIESRAFSSQLYIDYKDLSFVYNLESNN